MRLPGSLPSVVALSLSWVVLWVSALPVVCMSDKNQRARTLLTTISGAHRLRTGNRCEQDGGQYRVPISEVRDDPSGRTFLRRVGGSENKTKELYDSLMAVKSEDLSRYLRAVTGNSQCSARELGRLPLVWRQPDIEPGL